jgi:phosphate transport system substrate-binding protein
MPYEVDTLPAFFPSQGTLADRSYPLRRQVVMVLAEGKSGLGTGFVSFVANHKGQRIILKLGLAPQKIPAREVEIVHE